MFRANINAAYGVAAITKRKSRLKIYSGNKVYLNDGDTFEIEIYNPKAISTLCKIKLNGNYISNTGVVLRPGERVFLERYIDSNNKFIFSTYEVGNSKSTKKAIEMNGLVEVEFYDEYIPPPPPPIWYNPDYYVYYYDNSNLTLKPTVTYNNSNYDSLTTTSLHTSYSEGAVLDKLEIGDSENKRFNTNKSIETGRVGKGEKSNQEFTSVDMIFNSFTSNIVSYQILPESTKQIQGHNIRKYCTNCGTKLKKTYRYCPNCGENS